MPLSEYTTPASDSERPPPALSPADQYRQADVWRALDTVLDPELDEAVTSLDFVTRVEIDGDAVAVDFRLPTYWCSPNFAWIMAEDMRDALRALPWARAVKVTLADHLFARKINAAVNGGVGFGEAFVDARGNLEELRATFRRKAYLGRMAELIEALRADGRTDADLLAMTIGDLRTIARTNAAAADPLAGSALQGEGAQAGPVTEQLRREAGTTHIDLHGLAARYLQLRTLFGGAHGDQEAAFRTADGVDIAPADLATFLRGVRMARRGVEANGEMCRIYLRERRMLSTREGSDDHSRFPSHASAGQGPRVQGDA